MVETKKTKEAEESDLELNMFLGEMVSLINRRFNEQKNEIKALKEKTSGMEKQAREVSNLKKKLAELCKEFKESKKVNREMLAALKG